MNEEILKVFDIIKENINKNNIVYETEEGMFVCPLEEFAKKSPNEILNLLSFDINSIVARANTDDGMFVNDIATAQLLCHYIENYQHK